MAQVANLFDIIHLNKRLADKHIAAEVHLRDACGRQTLWFELKDAEEDTLSRAQDVAISYFAGKGKPIEFDIAKGINFWIKQF